jgi:hypothetical protein
MGLSTRTRLVVSIALIIFGLAVTFAAADSLINTGGGDKSHSSAGTSLAQVAGASGAEPDGTGEVLGAKATNEAPADKDHTERKRCDEDRQCEGSWGGGERSGTSVAATFGVSDDRQRQTDAPAVDHIRQLIPTVRDRVEDLLKIRDCTSSIGGDAICFDFGDGNYLVGDAPGDGAGELGFCTSDGYYFVSGPTPAGGAGVECPDGSAGDETGAARTPRARECTSSIGGDATCFAFGGGKYLVSDPFDDGEGELGFCTRDGYYFVAAPSAEGGSGGDCPDLSTEN